jgi:antibiotic biosynthesis monooxygenase (ABM) superfamily enzyme
MDSSQAVATNGNKPVTLVTQTSVDPAHDRDFNQWQDRVNGVVSGFSGYIDSKVMPPSPPIQPDWVIVQRFATVDDAKAWLGSPDRQQLVDQVRHWLIGRDDIHLVEEDDSLPPDQSVSAVISMKVTPGQEAAYRAWGQRIAAAQSHYPGFQGFRINPPIPGVQDDWVTILQFDNEPDLSAWMNSPERQRFLDEAKSFNEETHFRTVRSGFSQWFRVDGGPALAPVWKQNMLVLMALYPVVFLFGFFVQGPLLMRSWGWPFWLSLFAGNLAGIVILNWLVPWVSKQFTWWLQPAGTEMRKRTAIGIVVVVAIYALLMLAFSRFPPAL